MIIHPLSQRRFPAGVSRNLAREADAYSVYGQLTWHISERLRAFLDLRYTDETQKGLGSAWPVRFKADTFFDPVRTNGGFFGQNRQYLFFQERGDSSFDPSLRLQFDVSDTARLYGAYARGSKAGGFKANDANLSAVWESQLSSDRRLTAAASYYYSDEYFVQPTQAAFTIQEAFSKIDLRLALAGADGRWEIGINGRNLGDEMTIQHAYDVGGNRFNSLTVGRTLIIDALLRF